MNKTEIQLYRHKIDNWVGIYLNGLLSSGHSLYNLTTLEVTIPEFQPTLQKCKLPVRGGGRG